MPTNKKIAYIFLTICVVYSLITFNGIIDDFSPQCITSIEQISESSHLDPNSRSTNQVPGFYVLGAVIKSTSNISLIGFLTYPLQLLPLLTVFYIFALKISNSPILSSAATFLYVCSGTTGTSSIFFWPHGVGSVVYWTAFFLMCSIMLNPSYRRPEFILLFIICGCSLVFLSYNLYSKLILFIFSIAFVIWIIQGKKVKFVPVNYSTFLNCSSIFIITQLGLSNFVYETFIPMIITIQDDIKISALNKFISAYIHRLDPDVSVISELLINFPRSITVISSLKYFIVCLSIVFFVLLCVNKIYKKAQLRIVDIFILSFLTFEFAYIIVRTYIGGIAITSMVLPGVFCVIWLYHSDNIYKKWAIFAIIMLLILSPLYTYTIETNNLRNQQVYENEYLMYSSNWYFENKINNIGVSDEMTKNLMSMFIFQKYHSSSEIEILSHDNAGFLVQKLELNPSHKYYLINYQLRRMSLQNWVIIKSWSFFENLIDSNKDICKIYDVDSVSIYY